MDIVPVAYAVLTLAILAGILRARKLALKPSRRR